MRGAIAMALHSPDGVDLTSLRPALDSALEDFGAAARDQRAPAPPPRIDDTSLAGLRLSRQLGVLQSALERLAGDERAPKPAEQADRGHAGSTG
ncbi:MAG TPA: hypothetical protein VE964_10335, partial [Myxococcales bacterium]|nr:hypothetical protein [Myxococcales bacterium]